MQITILESKSLSLFLFTTFSEMTLQVFTHSFEPRVVEHTTIVDPFNRIECRNFDRLLKIHGMTKNKYT